MYGNLGSRYASLGNLSAAGFVTILCSVQNFHTNSKFIVFMWGRDGCDNHVERDMKQGGGGKQHN